MSKNSLIKIAAAKAAGAATVSTRSTRIHKGEHAPAGHYWLEFIVVYNRKRSVVAVPVPNGTTKEAVDDLKKAFIDQLRKSYGTA